MASWCESGEAHQIQALLASLERLPEQARHQLLEEACRMHPTLQHRRLSHDFLAVSRLAELLRRPSGATLTQGNPAHIRTFLIAALGNSFNQAHPGGKAVAGLDINPAESLAPVIGVTYFANLLGASETATRLKEAWLVIRGSAARLFLFNGVWNRAPELREEIASCARQAHVIIADEFEFPRAHGYRLIEEADAVIQLQQVFLIGDIRPPINEGRARELVRVPPEMLPEVLSVAAGLSAGQELTAKLLSGLVQYRVPGRLCPTAVRMAFRRRTRW